jgi:excisionase family DNA binding protein
MSPESKVGRTDEPRLPAHLAPITVVIERLARPLTREQAARVLRLHPRTLDRWARRGRLLTIDLGGTVRIPVAETLRLQPIAAPRRTA